MPAYARTDARVTFEVTKWLEVYGEIINIFNRENFHPRARWCPVIFPGNTKWRKLSHGFRATAFA